MFFNFDQMKAMIFKLSNYRLPSQHSRVISPIRYSSDLTPERAQQNDIKKRDEETQQKNLDSWLRKHSEVNDLQLNYWFENSAVRISKRKSKDIYNINSAVDMLKVLQNIKNFPLTFTELLFYLKRRFQRNEIAAQKYLPERVAVLKHDLAAAHFLLHRGGSVKFYGKPLWYGVREKNLKLPFFYVPGLFVECINAEGTNLYYEGLKNLSNLNYLSFLSLKNLKTVNDWFLDWISCEYHLTLKHLDISGCENVTYRGLSCFYRFECLEILNVEGVPDTPEFKLACLLLLQHNPYLDIKGIDLNIPEKIDPVKIEEFVKNPKT